MTTAIAIILVAAAILLSCVAVTLAGFWVSRRLREMSPRSQLLRRLPAAEAVLWACLVAVLLVGTVVGRLYPDGAVGSVLNTPLGLFAAFGGVLLAFVLAQAGLSAMPRRRAK